MHSLVISVISVVLVVVLLLATTYYGGRTLNLSRARADAVTVSGQGQQYLMAAQMFRTDVGRWPSGIDELVTSNYLKGMQNAPMGVWGTIQPRAPYYWVHAAVQEPHCRMFNFIVRRDDGIFTAARPSLRAQCFGPTPPYTIVMGNVAGWDGPALADVLPAADASLQVDESGGGYAVAPSPAN